MTCRASLRSAVVLLGTSCMVALGGPSWATSVEDAPDAAGMDGLAAATRAAAQAGPVGNAAAPRAVIESGSKVDIGNLFVFGDSYSRLRRKPFPNWAEQLKNDGNVGNLRGYAISGAQANSGASPNLAQEITAWRNAKVPFRSGDATVVYFGYNDIDSNYASFNNSRNGYFAAMNALIGKGANAGGRDIYVAMVHDWGSVPAYNGNAHEAASYRSQTKLWNSFVKNLPSRYANTVAVDLFTPIDRVLANPGQYGFNNVRTADPKHSATTALYDDEYHFGQHGQHIIEQTMLNYMSRSAEYANGLAMTERLQGRRQQDVSTGLGVGLAALGEEPLGLSAFPVGLSALPETAPGGDASRAQFAQAFSADRRDGGGGLNYALADGTMFGMTFSSYDDTSSNERQAGLATSSVHSDAISFYLNQKLGAFELGTDFSYSKDHHQKLEYDDVAAQHDRAGFDGTTMALAQRLGYPLRHQGMVLTPWAGVSYQMQQVDGFTIANPFVSDQTYSSTQVADTMAAMGLDARLDPIALGERASLTLFGGLSYTHGLVQDDYKVRIKEAAFNNVQDETIDRPQTRTLGLNLGGSLRMGADLSLDAGMAVDHDLATGTAEAGRIGVTYRFF